MTYRDDHVHLHDGALQIRSLLGTRTIPVADIERARLFPLTWLTGRYRVVGIGFGRLRTWFPWDTTRRSKKRGVEIDNGRFFKIGLTPDDPDAFLAALDEARATA